MGDGDRACGSEDSKPPPGVDATTSLYPDTQEDNMSPKGVDGVEPTEGSDLLSLREKRLQETPMESAQRQKLKLQQWQGECQLNTEQKWIQEASLGMELGAAPSTQPSTVLLLVLGAGVLALLLWAVGWAITGPECLPGGTLFGLIILLYAAVAGGGLLGLVRLPMLPPLPPLLGMLLAGFLLRNIPWLHAHLHIPPRWSSGLRSLALAVILVRAGLGLDPKALRKLKGVCVRLSVGPCLVEACAAALLAHLLLGLPWQWAFILGFVLGAVSPAVVVPSMLQLQVRGYGVAKGIPTLLMAAGSCDDILAITGFNTCLGMAFATGSTVFNVLRGGLEVAVGVVGGVLLGFFLQYFPSSDQAAAVMWKRAGLALGLAVLGVFGSLRLGLPGSGGLCTLVLAFLAGCGWAGAKAEVEQVVGMAWTVAQPFLFGLIGAEVSIASLRPETVGLCVATLGAALLLRVLTTFLMVCCAGFNTKEKLFISLAWLPKATVQAAIGSVALDTARAHGEKQLEDYGMDVLTVAFLAILTTAPVGSLLIGLLGPGLLQKSDSPEANEDGQGERALQV
ncbi:sodium/hydrogen exchanger 9B2 [Erinaceus europaeus]|uniref:Sodium/hydrogen exchanger 9B2 n=1 Tax=Erinaceus europaeus TaxID=9365 RepID=A0ABM3VVH2_ERIEU|nr:sodium/hydrogen exchanger 9B2 [Erinaceus europaeus]